MYNTFKNGSIPYPLHWHVNQRCFFFLGVWLTALELIREYATKYSSIQVMAGPLFDWDANGLADSDLSKLVSLQNLISYIENDSFTLKWHQDRVH